LGKYACFSAKSWCIGTITGGMHFKLHRQSLVKPLKARITVLSEKAL